MIIETGLGRRQRDRELGYGNYQKYVVMKQWNSQGDQMEQRVAGKHATEQIGFVFVRRGDFKAISQVRDIGARSIQVADPLRFVPPLVCLSDRLSDILA